MRKTDEYTLVSKIYKHIKEIIEYDIYDGYNIIYHII